MEDNFENKMKQLEEIVKKLENGELNLDDSVIEFEKGIKLSKECNKVLEETEKKISILINKNGEIKEEDFIDNICKHKK